MNLVLDIGNSYFKVAVFKGEDIIHLSSCKNIEFEKLRNEIQKLKKQYSKIENVILSSVSFECIELDDFLLKNFRFFLKLSHKTKIPIRNLYKTPETLGKDRLAAVIAVNNIFPNTDVLVFDAGTALTIDFINNKNEYKGGNISLGILMRYKALHHFTKKLPELSINNNFEIISGLNTNEAIYGGVQNGILYEVEGYIKQYKDKYPQLKVVFTGGDTFFFENRLKNKIFADPNIVLKGLNIIINYNAT